MQKQIQNKICDLKEMSNVFGALKYQAKTLASLDLLTVKSILSYFRTNAQKDDKDMYDWESELSYGDKHSILSSLLYCSGTVKINL